MKILSYVKSEDIHHMIANAGRKNSVYIDFSNDPSALLGKTENYALVFAEVSLTDEKIMLASKRLLEDCPALHIVFLMRECSFEHSMRAMRIGVKNILYGSDVNEMTLGRVIEDYKNNADETLYRRENINRLFEKLIFFQDDRLNEQNAVRLNSLFSLRGGGKSYFVAAVISSEFMIRQTHVSSLQKKISCEKICRLFSDFSGSDFDVCFVFYLDDVFYIVLALPHQPSSGRMAANVREVLTGLRRYAEKELSGSAVYLASRSRLDFRCIDKSLEELNILLNAYHVFGQSQIVLYSDYYAKDFNGSAYERLTESAVKMFDEIGKNGNYREHEEKIFSDDMMSSLSYNQFKKFQEYLRFEFEFLKKKVDPSERTDYDKLLAELVQPVNYRMLKNKVHRLAESVTGSNKNKYNYLITKCLQFIADNYMHNVGLYEAARQLNISTVYLSQLFKKEVGKNFNVYLNEYRMEKAKTLIIRGDYRLGEICEMVGFSNLQYFSKCFKKAYGMTPNEFRNRWAGGTGQS